MLNLALCAGILLGVVDDPRYADDWPVTRAERTNYAETSSHSDVVAFLDGLKRTGAPVAIQTIGQSKEGRGIPLAIASFPPMKGPAEAKRSGRPIVYIQANIHAGEVEGKEAALMVLRKLVQAGPKGLLGRIVLLVVPIYNADGNEKLGPAARNRSEQDGPPLVGVRASGEGFDLNRDAMKADALETRALLKHIYTTWDPHVMMDLHTTDGTRHGWELTYAPPTNPNTDSGILGLSRDRLLPAVRERMQAEFKLPLFDYGNASRSAEMPGWFTFGEEGHYCTNYVGLRNRIAILSEATSYIPFRDRVAVTEKFVTCVLDYVAAHAKEVVQATRAADTRAKGLGSAKRGGELGVRFEPASRGTEPVLLERPRTDGTRPGLTSRPKELDEVKMPIFDRFKITASTRIPAGYLIPKSEAQVVSLLRSHGIAVEELVEAAVSTGEKFAVADVKLASRPYQGHRMAELTGTYVPCPIAAAKGDYVVRTNQPLAVLLFHLLEAQSGDGVVAWSLLATPPEGGKDLSIAKLTGRLRLKTRPAN